MSVILIVSIKILKILKILLRCSHSHWYNFWTYHQEFMIIYWVEKLESGSFYSLPLTLWLWSLLLFSDCGFLDFVQVVSYSYFQFWGRMFMPSLLSKGVTSLYDTPIFYPYYRIQISLLKHALWRHVLGCQSSLFRWNLWKTWLIVHIWDSLSTLDFGNR